MAWVSCHLLLPWSLVLHALLLLASLLLPMLLLMACFPSCCFVRYRCRPCDGSRRTGSSIFGGGAPGAGSQTAAWRVYHRHLHRHQQSRLAGEEFFWFRCNIGSNPSNRRPVSNLRSDHFPRRRHRRSLSSKASFESGCSHPFLALPQPRFVFGEPFGCRQSRRRKKSRCDGGGLVKQKRPRSALGSRRPLPPPAHFLLSTLLLVER